MSPETIVSFIDNLEIREPSSGEIPTFLIMWFYFGHCHSKDV